MQLQGKAALVTGAGSGIGEATARLLAKEGAAVGCLDYDEREAREAAERINKDGGRAIPLVADIADPGQVAAAVERVVGEFGRLDIVVANAGINGVWAPLEDLTPEDWDRTLNTNLKGTFLTVKYAVPHLKKQGGAIVVTSSVNGTRTFSNTGATAYSSSKAGQVAFTKMIAVELGRWRIRANVICPGAIHTDISESTEKRNLEHVRIPIEFPKGGQIPAADDKPGESAQVAQLVLFLVSDASSHISGTEIWIDGAQTLVRG